MRKDTTYDHNDHPENQRNLRFMVTYPTVTYLDTPGECACQVLSVLEPESPEIVLHPCANTLASCGLLYRGTHTTGLYVIVPHLFVNTYKEHPKPVPLYEIVTRALAQDVSRTPQEKFGLLLADYVHVQLWLDAYQGAIVPVNTIRAILHLQNQVPTYD